MLQAQVHRQAGYYNETNFKGRLNGLGLVCSGVKVPGRGWRVSPLLSLFLCPHGMPRVCPAGRVGGQAAQPGSTRTLSPSVHVGRRWARRRRHMGQAVELRGDPAGQRHRSGVATIRELHLAARG